MRYVDLPVHWHDSQVWCAKNANKCHSWGIWWGMNELSFSLFGVRRDGLRSWKGGNEMRRTSRNHGLCFESLEKALAESPETYGLLDLIAFGFPCQDISQANAKGKGLRGDKSSIFFECMRIVNILNPKWLLIENVPRLLSINDGWDMAVVLRTLAESGYGWAYRVLDTQFFDCPQRRERVFIVGRFGGQCPPEILFEQEGGGWHDKTNRKIREVGLCISTRDGERQDQTIETLIASTIQATDYKKTQHGQFGNEGNLVCSTIQSTDRKLRKFNFGENLVASPCVAGTLGATPRGNSSFIWQDTYIAEVNSNGKGKTPRVSGKLDSRRGIVIGNAVSVPVAKWIGERILKYWKWSGAGWNDIFNPWDRGNISMAQRN